MPKMFSLYQVILNMVNPTCSEIYKIVQKFANNQGFSG